MKIKRLYNISIIEKYISKQILFGLLIVSAILLGIAWFSQIIRLLSYLVNNNLSMWTFLKMTSLLLPDLVAIILPIALFAVVLFVYNRLISDKELIIMEAVGMNVKQLAKPALYIAVCMTIFLYFLTLRLGPIYARKYKTFAYEVRNDLSALLIKEGEFNQLTSGLTIYVKNSRNNVLTDIFINDQRTPNRIRTILAEQGIVRTSKNNITLTLENGSIQEKMKGKYSVGNFESYTADLGVITTSSQRNLKASELGNFELIFARELGYADKKTYPKYLVELHKRLIMPLYNIIFTLIALIAVFKSPLNKRSENKNMIFAVAGMVTIQMGYISIFNFLRIKMNLYPIVYLLTITIIYVLFKILYSEKTIKLKRRKKA